MKPSRVAADTRSGHSRAFELTVTPTSTTVAASGVTTSTVKYSDELESGDIAIPTHSEGLESGLVIAGISCLDGRYLLHIANLTAASLSASDYNLTMLVFREG